MNKTKRSAYDAALDVVKSLRAAGFEALFAGGCVRDQLLQEQPKDFDVATSARPEEVVRLYPRARCVGAKFGVVLVRRFGHDIEVATFRTDGDYADGRRPEDVSFGSARDDAHRRDFTINGLFFDPLDERIIDFVDGQRDIRQGIVRTIGDPDKRFEEDHLRMLRAIRFASRLSFAIHPDTMTAIRRHADRLSRISPERIWIELSAILSGSNRAVGWRLLMESTLRDVLSPQWPPDSEGDDRNSRRLSALPAVPMAPAPAFAACAPRPVAGVCESLRMSNRLTARVTWLVSQLDALRQGFVPALWQLKQMMANGDWNHLLCLWEADLRSAGEDLAPHRLLTERANAIAPDAVAPDPFVTGEDLLNMGGIPGPQIGEVLDAVYRDQLDEKIGTREQALEVARRSLENRSG